MSLHVGINVVLAVLVLGCTPSQDPKPPSSDVVSLLTGVDSNTRDGACYTNSAQGPLTIDPTYGTAITNLDTDPKNTKTVPVIWRPGFTAHRVGSEVEVLDPQGNVVATTGRSYRIQGGFSSDSTRPGFVACGFVRPEP